MNGASSAAPSAPPQSNGERAVCPWERLSPRRSGLPPLNGAAIVHYPGFWGSHETPPAVRKRSEESSARRRLKANSIASILLLGWERRAPSQCLCRCNRRCSQSRRPAWAMFRLPEPMLPVTITAMGMEFPRDRRSADDSYCASCAVESRPFEFTFDSATAQSVQFGHQWGRCHAAWNQSLCARTRDDHHDRSPFAVPHPRRDRRGLRNRFEAGPAVVFAVLLWAALPRRWRTQLEAIRTDKPRCADKG
jgi:hypothetical protein